MSIHYTHVRKGAKEIPVRGRTRVVATRRFPRGNSQWRPMPPQWRPMPVITHRKNASGARGRSSLKERRSREYWHAISNFASYSEQFMGLHTHTHTHTHTHAHTHTHTHTHTRTSIVFIHTYAYTHMCNVHTCTNICIHTYTHVRRTHLYKHIYTYVHKHALHVERCYKISKAPLLLISSPMRASCCCRLQPWPRPSTKYWRRHSSSAGGRAHHTTTAHDTTPQYSTAQHSTAQHTTAQHSTAHNTPHYIVTISRTPRENIQE